MRRLPWRRLTGCLMLAVAVHLLAVWAAPRLIMQRVMTQLALPPGELAVLPPMTDHLQRRIVMPSPDLLYALCPVDLTGGPLRVRADPQTAGGYWSIALYAANSDNVFVLNDREAAGRPVDLLLQAFGAPVAALPPGARGVTLPTARGLLLMRVLVGDRQRDRATAESARRSLRCEVLAGSQAGS